MAVLNKKKTKVSDEIPTSSMADIAFLLLIFFLVTTTFPKDKGLAVVLPEPGETAEVSQKNILHLIVQPTGIVDVKRGENQQIQQMRPSNFVWLTECSCLFPDGVSAEIWAGGGDLNGPQRSILGSLCCRAPLP